MLKALIKKQIAELFRGFYISKKTGKAKGKSKVIGLVVLFLFIFISVAFSFAGISFLFADTFIPMGLDWLYFTLLSLFSIFIGTIGNAFTTFAALYKAKDNDLLFSLPIPKSKIIISRVLPVYLMSALYTSIVFLPSLAVYWLVASFNILSIIFGILMLVALSLIVLTLSCILGYVIAVISSKLKNSTFIKVLLSVTLIGLYYFVYFRLQTYLNQIVSNAEIISGKLRPIYPLFALGAASAGDVLSFIFSFAFSIVISTITIAVISINFVKLSSGKEVSTSKKFDKNLSRMHSVNNTLFRRELLHFSKSSAYMLNCGLGILIMLLGAIVIGIKSSQISQMISSVQAVFPGVTNIVPMIFICIILLLTSMMLITAPSISIEGNTLWALQTLPISPSQIITAKQKLQLYLSIIPLLAITVTVSVVFKFSIALSILFTICAVIFNMLTSAMGLFFDLLKPNLVWTNEAVPVKQSLSVLFTMFIGWGIVIAIGALYIFVLPTLPIELYVLGIIIILSVFTVLLNKWLYSKGCKILKTL